MKTKEIEENNLIDQISTWPFVFMISMAVFFVLLMQSMWNFVFGLYFSFAYEAVVIPSMIYLMLTLHSYSKGNPINQLKLLLLAAAFMSLFMPTLYLLTTQQVDFHTAIFGKFNPSLKHMPYANILPFIFLVVLFAPIKNYLK